MDPFESARIEASQLRNEMLARGVGFNGNAYEFVRIVCKSLDVAVREVKPGFPLLKGADATILVARKCVFVRSDVAEETKAFLVAHELGHMQLHPLAEDAPGVSQSALTEPDTNGVREVESYGVRERLELQANVFAREFLLPRELARRDFFDRKRGALLLAKDYGLPLELVRLQLYDATLLPNVIKPTKIFRLPVSPTKAQAPAVNSDEKITLVEAGPGTGKTTTLILRLRRLIAAGVAPENIVILTFSNKAARELVERARVGEIPGADRVWIGTFHAFGLEFLRKFGNLHGLAPRFPVLDRLATLAMLEIDIVSADLEIFDPLSNPFPWLETALDTITRAKDEVFSAAMFESAIMGSSNDAEIDAKRRDVARIFQRYELLLSRRKAVDLTDLLCITIRLLQSGDPSVAHFLSGIHHVMVDEYQDVNRASALLVKELAKAARTLWVVGDANQAIYAFMGASSSNLEKFQVDFPGATAIPLSLNHRSSQEIVDVFSKVASRNPLGRPTISLEAERGKVGHGPRHMRTSNKRAQLHALCWRIRELEKSGIPLAQQAVIVYRNADAAELASGLESEGIPVLYLGNIFERPEVKDLICLMQLASDPYGVNLVRHWHLPLLAISREGADLLFAQTRAQEKDWRQVSGEGLAAGDMGAWKNLIRLCDLITDDVPPWEALSLVLLEDGSWLRQLAAHPGHGTANALMAVWQFVHFCRSPDGTGRRPSLRSLPHRIRDRIRLGEDRSMRAVPPEADGMNAVRILTAHGSKGLEFDAVHFLGVTKGTYETPKLQLNKLLPDEVFDSSMASEVLKNERHNLLYVAVSRPRFYLTVYSTAHDELPSALDGVLTSIEHVGLHDLHSVEAAPIIGEAQCTTVSLEEYLQFTKCPQRHEMSARAKYVPRDELKVHRSIDIATRRAMALLAEDNSLIAEESWPGVLESVLPALGLHEHPSAPLIRERVEQRVRVGRNLFAEGGLNSEKILMGIGALQVELQPDQVFVDGANRKLRFVRSTEASFSSMKQPLAALLDAHHQAGGETTTIEIATLSDGKVASVGKIKPPTRGKYEIIAASLCAKNFPASPESSRTCYTCAYMFPCNKCASE